jgi:polyisoprenoid-binding protein YceI
MAVNTKVTDWIIDTNHSTFEFTVRHVVVSTIKGAFSGVTGEIRFDPDTPEHASVQATIDISTLDTHHQFRDGKILGEGFFEVEKYPTATFTSTSVSAQPDGHFAVVGDLTLRGVTKEMVFDTTFVGTQGHIDGTPRGAFVALGSIKRTDFGFGLGNDLPGGGKTHVDEVTLAMYTTVKPKPSE